MHGLFWQILVLDSLAQYGVEILFNGHHYPFDILTCGDAGMRGAVGVVIFVKQVRSSYIPRYLI